MAGKRKKPAYKKYSTDDYARDVADKFIAQIEAGTAPWQKPWEPGVAPDAPQNASTGKPYQGINAINLAASQPAGSDDPRWVTYNQAQAMGAQVRKGEKSPAKVESWKFDKEKARRDENGNVVKDADGNTVKDKEKLDKPFVSYTAVFHASQVDGLPPYEPKVANESDFERHERCEKILEKSGADLRHERGDRAFYSPSQDQITLPEKDQFHTPDGYYSTALHELGHWTGHEDRLNRDLSGGFGSENYAKEELRAEISSYMVGQELAVGHDPGQHAAYAANWVKVLKDDPNEIIRASKDAQKISNMVLGFEPEMTLDQAPEKANQDDKEQEAMALVAGEKAAEAEPVPEQPETEAVTAENENDNEEPEFEPDAEPGGNGALFGGDAADDFNPAEFEDEPEPEPEPEPEEDYGPSM